MQTPSGAPPASAAAASRLHYLDWLRVLAVFGVFLFHAVHPFDVSDWQVKNAETSLALSIPLEFLGWWGMPFFFLISGAAAGFALKRRTPGQYLRERFKRLLVPFVVGTLLFSPAELYFEWANRFQRGEITLTFAQSLAAPFTSLTLSTLITPRWFGYGFHLWFLGFLFSMALITLPLLRWLKGEPGRRFLSRLADVCGRRGGILLFILPLALIRLTLLPFFPHDHDWADFVYQMAYFVLGFILYEDPRIVAAVRRDGRIVFGAAIVFFLIPITFFAVGDPFAWAEDPSLPQYYLVQGLVVADSWCWVLSVLVLGINALNFSNRLLQYAGQAMLPFYIVHQPVIIAIAFYVVQWQAGIPVKLLAVLVSSFLVSIGIYELIIRRVPALRALFGMTS